MLKPKLYLLMLFTLGLACTKQNETSTTLIPTDGPFLTVLGIAQDAGYPQAGCQKDCCMAQWSDKTLRKMVSCLGLVNPSSEQSWLFDATPDFKDQLQILESYASLAGIFLTHAHIGHYTGLMQLGREVMGADEVPVFAMPYMAEFLENNGPWSQLVELNNIKLVDLEKDSKVKIADKLYVTPWQVPHRDEFSETVGYLIEGPNKKALFIPDIDKWDLWNKDIVEVIKEVDLAFLDGSFFKNGEIPGRDMSQIPHPFIQESMTKFQELSEVDKNKIHFIHFNHTNPVLRKNSEAQMQVVKAGFNISEEGAVFDL